jgi:DNA-binding protein H-NS
MPGDTSKMTELGFKLLSGLIIPVGIYIINMSTNVKLLEQKVETQETRIQELKDHSERMVENLKEYEVKINAFWRALDSNNKDILLIKDSVKLQSEMVKDVYEYILKQQGRTP